MLSSDKRLSIRLLMLEGPHQASGPSFISPAALRLGCSEIALQEVAYSAKLPMTVATATRTWWDALPAYAMAIAERDDK